jgi:hypothetical protein
MIKLRESLHRAIAVLGAAIMVSAAAAQDADPPRLNTNEAYIAEVTRSHTLAIDDPMAVFAYVFGSPPALVRPIRPKTTMTSRLTSMAYAIPVASRSMRACAPKARWCSPITKIEQLGWRTRKAPHSSSDHRRA